MVDIDRSVKTYYEQAELSEEQLQKLLAMQEAAGISQQEEGVSTVRKQRLPNGWLRIMAAASIVLALALIFVINPDSVAERVAQEVAMNHNKALTVEYPANSYEVLSKQMDKLDFTLRAPSEAVQQGLALVGGRYCSIQGQLAAQIKLSDSDGRIYTLYQTHSGEQLKPINAAQLQLDQVDIQLWQEKGLLFALAGTVE
jgi:anti-sigma factor RsiW